MIAHVQIRAGGLPATEGCYQAWRALEERGWDVRAFSHVDGVDVHPDQPVIGGLDNVAQALGRLGVTLPDIDYPAPLRPYLLDPDTRVETMGWARQAREHWPLFVKPTTGRKEFTGLVLRRTDDLLTVTHVPDDFPVFVARPADLRSCVEWRAFVVGGDVRDIRPYSRCVDADAPSALFVRMLVEQWHSRPVGFSLDVVNLGSRAAPDWRVVECNDGYALGTYGLFRGTYAELLARRWWELTGSTESWG